MARSASDPAGAASLLMGLDAGDDFRAVTDGLEVELRVPWGGVERGPNPTDWTIRATDAEGRRYEVTFGRGAGRRSAYLRAPGTRRREEVVAATVFGDGGGAGSITGDL